MMNISTEYFMERLANGESMETIGAEMAALMNAAQTQYAAAQAAEAAKEDTKRELVRDLVDILQELAVMEGIEDEVEFTEEDYESISEMVLGTLKAMRELKDALHDLEHMVADAAPAAKAAIRPTKPTDDEILHDFLRGLVS